VGKCPGEISDWKNVMRKKTDGKRLRGKTLGGKRIGQEKNGTRKHAFREKKLVGKILSWENYQKKKYLCGKIMGVKNVA